MPYNCLVTIGEYYSNISYQNNSIIVASFALANITDIFIREYIAGVFSVVCVEYLRE